MRRKETGPPIRNVPKVYLSNVLPFETGIDNTQAKNPSPTQRVQKNTAEV